MIARLVNLVADKHGLSENSRHLYKVAMTRFTKYMGGMPQALFATREEADAWIGCLKAQSPSSARTYSSCVSAMFGHLHADGIVDWNPFEEAGLLPSTRGISDYSEAVTLAEVRAIIDHAIEVGHSPDSTAGQVMVAVVALLHARYCLPYSSISELRIADYRPGPSFGVIAWRNLQSKETCYQELDGKTSGCLDRYLASRGRVLDDDPLFARCNGKNKGGFYTTNLIMQKAAALYRKAGVSVGKRNMKLAAVRLAAESGANVAEISNITSSISLNMAYVASREQAKTPAAELWNRLNMEMDRKAPIATGSVSVRHVEEVLGAASGCETIEFTVTAAGKLVLSVPDAR